MINQRVSVRDRGRGAPRLERPRFRSRQSVPHAFFPEQESAPHVRVELDGVQVTPPEHEPEPHVTAQEPVALQVMGPEQEELPQLTMQLEPPQVMPPEHEVAPHSMSHEPALLQSTAPLQPLSPHCTRHAMPGGQVTPPEHLPAQSITQRPLLSQVPPGQEAAEHAVVAAPLDVEEPHAATTTMSVRRKARIRGREQITRPGARVRPEGEASDATNAGTA